MVSALTLTLSEIRLIKGMLLLEPRPDDQVILSYFTRPGRDLNHRVIAEIKHGSRWDDVPAAAEVDVLAFMARALRHASVTAALTANATAPLTYRFIGALHLDWWPVGQGLFSSGAIVHQDIEPLAWVYDCGTTSSDNLMQTALNSFKAASDERGVTSLRLVVLSHFDKDHISGFVRLLQAFPVQTLLIPYIPRWRRLTIALSQGVAFGDPVFDFFVDPTGYLLQASGGRVEEIIFVQGTGPDDLPADLPLEPEEPEGPGARFEFDTAFKVEEGAAPPEAQGDPSVESYASTSVRFLKPGGRIVANLYWEFVPYNDLALAPLATPAFLATAEHLVSDLLDPLQADPQGVLDVLKAHYQAVFVDSEARNAISLFLYSGPLSPQIELSHGCDNRDGGGLAPARFSQMLTGDGFLNDDARCDAFEHFYSSGQRRQRSAFLQVMHHGSEKNWRPGVANWLSPDVSLFSSDPAHGGYRHPHVPVWLDFAFYGPVQVDRFKSYHFTGLLMV